MKRFRTVMFGVVASAVLLVALGAPVATAAAPETERITISDTFLDEFLTEACGVEVTTTATGHITFRTFPDRPIGPQSLNTINIGLLATAGDNVIRFRDVGADLVRISPDGTVTLMIIGQIPFGFTGVLKIDLETGEVTHEPTHTLDTARACELLTA